MRVLLRSPPLVLGLGLLLLNACTESSTGVGEDAATIRLELVAGDEQVWIAGYELPDVLVVKVTGVRGRPVPGIPQAVVRKLVGWETDAMFHRYFLTDETILKEAGDKMARAVGQSSAKVGPLRAKTN